jgi:hypothetical protein
MCCGGGGDCDFYSCSIIMFVGMNLDALDLCVAKAKLGALQIRVIAMSSHLSTKLVALTCPPNSAREFAWSAVCDVDCLD